METIRFTRRKLPHWEVAGGRYFVTVRCADSLPAEAIQRLAELNRAQQTIVPNSPQFAAGQRKLFRTLEKYLNAGHGDCPLREPNIARIVIAELEALADWGIAVPHYTVMPNHWHALLVPRNSAAHSLSAVMKRVKGRSAARIRRLFPGRGAFWQTEWFDRWVRSDSEWERMVEYIHNNPVKAGLASSWTEHPFTK